MSFVAFSAADTNVSDYQLDTPGSLASADLVSMFYNFMMKVAVGAADHEEESPSV
jgi:hypothetical protein